MSEFHRDWNITELSTKLSLHVARSVCKIAKSGNKSKIKLMTDIFIYTWNNFMKS